MTRKADPRSARVPTAPGALPVFTPVPRKCERHDGWTPERQRDFIAALAETGSVDAAARAVDMAPRGAYALRREPGAESFREAWRAALDCGVERIEDIAMERAINGVEEPVYSYGKQVGTRRRYNDRLLMFMLRNRSPERFAAGGARGMNALDKQRLAELKEEWTREAAIKRNVTAAEVRASIDRKIEGIRQSLAREHAQKWALLSEETRAAWDAFVALRDRDLDAIEADEALRSSLALRPFSETPDPPTAPPPGWRDPPPLPAPKTTWTLKDENFEP